jgi:hypothetical protein
MDEEKLKADIAEAIGKASASLCLHASLVATLVKSGALTKPDAATLAAVASTSLRATFDLSNDAKMIGESALRGCSASWTGLVTKN